MSKTKVFSMHLLLLVLLASSCSRVEETYYEPGEGGVRIDLATELPATRADLAEGSLNVDDFKVEILNSKGVIFKRWNTYAEYKSGENAAFHMNAGGPYTLRATYGDSLASGWSAGQRLERLVLQGRGHIHGPCPGCGKCQRRMPYGQYQGGRGLRGGHDH